MCGIKIYTDGGARGNPGPAAIALVIFDKKGRLLKTHSEYIGTATNNVAEYRAVLKALTMAKAYKTGSVLCTLDSKLVANQLSGNYKIKKPHLRELFDMVKEAEKKYDSVKYEYVTRDDKRIKIADRLLNEMLDMVKRTTK
jgi:ribonuclease HI